MSITLAELRTAVRQRADIEESLHIADSELTSYINSSIAELYDLLVSCYGDDYYASSYDFNTVTGQTSYALPATFYKARGVDINIGGRWCSVDRFNWNERNLNTDFGWDWLGTPNVRYRIMGNNLVFSSPATGAFSVKLWFVPLAAKLSADGDTFDDINQYAEYVITDGAIKCMQKEESDVSVLAAQKGALIARIQAMASNRDSEKPDSITDIYEKNYKYWYWWR